MVVDGLNDQHDRGGAVRHEVPADGDLAQEFALAAAIVAAGRDAGVTVVDIVNRSALCSVVWCSRADCFVAPLGAALAKYRWLCNTPGLVLSSRWNLEHRADLHIYDAPAALEGSSEMLFNRADEVQDCTPDRDAGGVDGRGNFVVSRPAILDRLRRLAAPGQHGPGRVAAVQHLLAIPPGQRHRPVQQGGGRLHFNVKGRQVPAGECR